MQHAFPIPVSSRGWRTLNGGRLLHDVDIICCEVVSYFCARVALYLCFAYWLSVTLNRSVTLSQKFEVCSRRNVVCFSASPCEMTIVIYILINHVCFLCLTRCNRIEREILTDSSRCKPLTILFLKCGVVKPVLKGTWA
jgi:hypothetical protein